MIKNKSSFHMGDEINGYGQQVHIIADEITPPRVSQENVRLTPNFNKHLQKLIFSIPAVNNPNQMGSAMSKMLGAQTAVNQVFISNTSGQGMNQTASLDFRLANRNASSGAYLQASTVVVKSGDDKKNGWYEEGDYEVYYKNNKLQKNKFIEGDDGKTYYVDGKGHKVKNKWISKWFKKYYFDSDGVMQTGQQLIDGEQYLFGEDGKKIKIYIIENYDFIFDTNKKKENEELARDLMELHQAYHEHKVVQEFVTQGSILACTNGTKLVKLDTSVTIDVRDLGTGAPILGCNATKVGINICSFTGCKGAEVAGLPRRKLIEDGYKTCIPLLDKEWKQAGDSPYMWNSVTGESTKALKSSGGVVCRYGGYIGVIEVPVETVIAEDSENLRWIPNPIMQISGQSSQENTLNKWIQTLNTTITNSNRTQAEKEKLKWNQDKINTIWDVCTQFNKDYDVQVDPRLLLAIIFKEGTGSFNTSSSNLAGDGQHGIEFNFLNDVENAVDVLGGKIIAYPYFKDDFSKARADAYALGLEGIKEKDDLIHYLNWETPRLQLITNNFSCGAYAGDSTWHRGIRQIYSELAYDDAPADYTNYVISIGKAKFTEVANKHGITVKKVTFKAKQNGQDSYGNATTGYSIVGTVL